MNVYEGRPEEDLLLCQWYETLVSTTELASTFPTGLHALRDFLVSWSPHHRALIYEVDAQGMWFACWWEPFFSAAAFGVWVRASHRHRKIGMQTFDQAVQMAFQYLTLLVALTKQSSVVAVARHVGFQVVGDIPALFDGEAATVLYLTKEAFDEQARRRHILQPCASQLHS